jgi:ATP-dependent Lhr-like helicase
MDQQPASWPQDGLPEIFAHWFAGRGWRAHDHQLVMLEAARAGGSALLVAPTGGGKTLAGFLPSLIELAAGLGDGLHTLYVSPLKALAVDIHRNLLAPIEEMGLEISCETRTGDTPQSKRVRQRRRPPQILLTTPESLALLLSYHDAPALFRGLRSVVVDELHALAHTKRGDLLALGLARLTTLAPEHRRVGLSATVHDPGALRRWLAMDGRTAETVRQVEGASAAKAKVAILTTEEYLPWSGHMALHAIREVYVRLKRARTTIIFVNTRAQAELVFQELWHLNEDKLRIALHHGSLAREQRRKVEAAMARGELEAVVATSSLDLGIDWAAVDLVVQVGAPKGAARLLQRIGRANHRLDQPSEALLVPANRFEVLECRAAIEALDADSLDGMDERPGGLDVLAQHVLGTACSGPFRADDLYAEVRRAAPYRDLSRDDFERVQEFVATGGYALKAYERFRRLKRDAQGAWRVAGVRHVRRYRSNVGTIVEAPRLKVKLKGGRVLGEVEEYFASGLVAGDSFIFSGRLLTFLTIREDKIIVAPAARDAPPKVPAYVGGRLPLSTQLAERVRALLETPAAWRELPGAVAEWLSIQRWASVLPPADGLLVETFPRGEKAFLVAYCFEGRNAHQTLGMLLTRRMERAGLGPLGFVATDYVIAVWSLKPAEDLDALFDEDMLGDDLEDWMAESSMLRRTFRQVAVIAGLIDQRVGGRMRSGREMTVSADLIYDVLRRHQPDHILLQATRLDAAGGLTDIARLAAMLKRVAGKIHHRRLARVSPLAVPILLEIGREQVYGGAIDELLDEGAEGLIAEAMEGMAQAELPL